MAPDRPHWVGAGRLRSMLETVAELLLRGSAPRQQLRLLLAVGGRFQTSRGRDADIMRRMLWVFGWAGSTALPTTELSLAGIDLPGSVQKACGDAEAAPWFGEADEG